MPRAATLASLLVILLLPPPAGAQETGKAPDALPVRSALFSPAAFPGDPGDPALRSPLPPRDAPAPTALAAAELERMRRQAGPSLSRHLMVGGGIGALMGSAFGLAVVSFADCSGSGCTTERVVGVAGLSLGGAAVGALAGAAVYLVRR